MTSSVTKKNYFPIVGIGTSAGGLEALEKFLRNMPETNKMSFVVIQHLDPNHTGVLPELLQRFTSMKVLQATDALKVKPGHVYVIPPKKSLTLIKGELNLCDPLQPRGLRLPIDIFFRSLAENSREMGVGIILSGMGSDGSLGIKAIKEKNGLVLVQEPSDAKFDGMPRSAMQSVNPDVIAKAEDLPEKLIALLGSSPPAKREMPSKGKNNLEEIINILHQKTGHDFSLYKKTTLLRRIERRKEIHQIERLQDYIRLLMGNPAETEILFKELLIGVTNFFRDPEVWTKLRENVLPDLISKLPDDHTLRAWVVSCSTGEEAYSLAIAFRESVEMDGIAGNVKLLVFATDIDSDAIAKARRGLFSRNIAVDVSQELLVRYFTPEGDGYRVNANIREMIVFAEQNVIRDPPYTKLDFLSCRNLLIYMEPELQKKLISLFHYALKPDGILLLGSSESLGMHKNEFSEIDVRSKIFRRSSGFGSRLIATTPDSFYNQEPSEKEIKPHKEVESLQGQAEQFILQNYAPATVVVNEKGDIVFIAGHTRKYLEPVAGKANWNIHAMSHESFGNELPGAIRKAISSPDNVILRNIKIGTGNNPQYTDITFEHIKNQGALQGLIIISFADVPQSGDKDVEKKKTKRPSNISKDLEGELRKANEDLQSTREEMQTSQEELKSMIEEHQSTNEELQSTNEELTTSKEEMQSLNEELQTINSELQSKINDLIQSNNDMNNLLKSTELAILFLDQELNIRRFTESLTGIFNLRNADIGRPYTDLTSNLDYPEMAGDARTVLETLTPKVTEVNTSQDSWYSVRIMPYRTYDNLIDGLVITFTNITHAKNLEFQLRSQNNSLQ